MLPALHGQKDYIFVAEPVQKLDAELQCARLKDVECASDQFIIGTQVLSGIKAVVTKREESCKYLIKHVIPLIS